MQIINKLLLRKFNRKIKKTLLNGAGRGAERIAICENSYTVDKLALSLINCKKPIIAILTGFPIFLDSKVVIENDGPLGAGQLAYVFSALSYKTVIMSDDIAKPVLESVLDIVQTELKNTDISLLTFGNDNIKKIKEQLKKIGVTHLISIERPGRASDGKYYNMNAYNITEVVTEFDALFVNCSWETAAFGDGGNEIGMGNIDKYIIDREIKHGGLIASETKVNYLTVCGVSNWGALALIASMIFIDQSLLKYIFRSLSEDFAISLFKASKKAGAVDGVTKKQSYSVDGIPYDYHLEKLKSFKKIIQEYILKVKRDNHFDI